MRRFNDLIARAPDNEGGADDGNLEAVDAGIDSNDDNVSDVGDSESGDSGEAAEKPLSVREQLKKSIEEVRAEDDKRAKPVPKRKANAASEAAPAAQSQNTQTAQTLAPSSLSQEAKAEWDKTPLAIQQAFIKREADMQKGVDELKQKYSLIDQALAPHQDALRQMNATGPEAVNRMFLWFKALAGNPAQAFPGLAKSFGLDWNKVVQATTGQQPGQTPQGQQAPAQAEIPEAVKNYIGQLEQRIQHLDQGYQQVYSQFGNIQNDIQQQQMAKTNENLAIWSKDKEFFQDVRNDMAALVQANLIPLKNGQVDLDTVYERAIHFNPEVRAKVLAKQQQADAEVRQQQAQAETTARQQQTAKARRASVSIPASSAPGAGNGAASPQRKPGQRMSVRDSLRDSIRQLRDQ